jgi:hypothetical protein
MKYILKKILKTTAAKTLNTTKMRKTVSGVDLTLNSDGSVWIYRNTKNKASVMISRDNDFFMMIHLEII